MLGNCLTLADMTANITGPGTWDAGSGVFTATLPGKGTCGGGGGADVARLQLTCKACGTLKVTASATGYTAGTVTNSFIAFTSTNIVSLNRPGGGSPSDFCATGAMTGTSTGTRAVDCNTVLTLQFARDNLTNMGAISVTCTVEVVP